MAGTESIEGLRELGLALKALPKEISGKAGGPLLKALRKAAKPIQDKARSLVRRKTGTLHDNIIIVRDKRAKQKGMTEGVQVTVRYKAKGYKDNARNRRTGRVGGTYKNYGPLFYAKFIEFGTSKAPAYPFMRPAFETSKGELLPTFKKELALSIDAAVRKLSPKA